MFGLVRRAPAHGWERWLALVRGRRAAYRNVFSRVDADLVLADLERFCHYRKTTHVIGDATGSAQLEGRRQVFLRIAQMIEVTDEELDKARRRALLKEVENV